MFSSKKKNLFDSKSETKETSVNPFVESGKKESARTLSGNNAEKFSTTGNEFVDQFSKLSSFRELRTYREIEQDMSTLWSINPEDTVKFAIYTRMITRSTMLFDGTKTESIQRGGGLRHESIMRMLWLYLNHNDAFWNNINLFISAGSWKDIIQMMSYDIQANGWEGRVLDWEKLSDIIIGGLENPNTSELIKKYLPQIKSVRKVQNMSTAAQADVIIGKFLANKIFKEHKSYEKYRKLKSSGTAHEWQQLISKGKMLAIDFDSVHGRALSQLVSSKFLENNNLTEKYEIWIDSKPIAKFTGFVHELFVPYINKGTGWYNTDTLRDMRPHEIKTINKQFDGLVETAKKGAKQNTSLIVVRDTSSSMGCDATGTKVSCNLIAKSLALFFSEMLPEGAFAKSWIEFNSDAKLHQWKGDNAYEKWINDKANYIGSTNFQSVINLFCKIKQDGVDESEFPTGILCISDGEFDAASLGKTNVETARIALSNAGFSKEYVDNFQIVLWNLANRYYNEMSGEKFETYGNVDNVFYFSGYEPSTIAFLTGVDYQQKEPKNAEEVFEAAMNQELLNMIKV